MDVVTTAIETAIFAMIQADGGRSISPEQVARAVALEAWRRALPQVKSTAISLAGEGRLSILRHGKPVDPRDFKGVYRLGAVGEPT